MFVSNTGNPGYLLNNVNPIGGRFAFGTKEGEKVFHTKASVIAKKKIICRTKQKYM
ncbi:hypothetical protein [Flavobacterium sp. JP2137]|uniref:hypothetical protein n=1 Tax=Flavobacterium sp. JP2137 TaxID=3414510 RepID=UPI003D2FE740